MTRVRRSLLLPVALVVITGCGSDPAGELRNDVAAVTEAANVRDADRVRDRAGALLATIEAQADRGVLEPDRAAQLTEMARAVQAGADAIDEDLIELRRLEAEAEAERQRIEQEREQVEQERAELEAERKQAEEEAARRQAEQDKKDEEKKGEGKRDDDEDD